MRARKVVTRSGRKYRGDFPSKKLNRMVQWESPLERDAILHFEFSPGITSYQEQPELILYEHDGEAKKYYPDFALTLKNGDLIHVEVKPVAKLLSPRLVSKLNAIIDRYDNHQACFRLLTDQFLRQEPKLRNLNSLHAAQHYTDDIQHAYEICMGLLFRKPECTILELSQQIGLKKVLMLLAQGKLCCDLNQELLVDTNVVRLVEGVDHDALLI